MPVPIWYTFGNHMHWVDMEWLWGYHVLPGSIRDMLHFCRETGAKGNVNFDGIGYEKLAAEDPEALAELREAVENGTIEVVGASYGQPYGLFHGGESNIRQRIYGARAVRRLLGVWPKTFWEEEFDFFPQLPQMLKGAGFEYASLFFQWTWHTPEVPKEEVPVIWWEGIDGSRLLTATRNRLNLHQWPEDVQILMDELASEHLTSSTEHPPLILQWLELMPSPDWMCRSEVLLPQTKELLGDPRFEVHFATLSEYLHQHREAPTKRYTMDEVWHGMSLGKNGDNMRRRSQTGEAALLAAETYSALAGLFGRPYAQWDVYPTWEIEEAWRLLLQAQHHDNDECEGLCGHIGKSSYDQSHSFGFDITERVIENLTDRVSGPADSHVVFNPLGWSRNWDVVTEKGTVSVVTVPACGYVHVPASSNIVKTSTWQIEGDFAEWQDRHLHIKVDLKRSLIYDLRISETEPLCLLTGRIDGQEVSLQFVEVSPDTGIHFPQTYFSDLRWRVDLSDQDHVVFKLHVPAHVPGALDINIEGYLPQPDPGMNPAIAISLPWTKGRRIVADQPYSVSELNPHGSFLKKYPTGDWMTSPQWFEDVHRPYTALSFVDFLDNQGKGALIMHDGSQQWFVNEDGTSKVLLSMYDPWDERFFDRLEANFRILPHTGLSNAKRWKAAQEFIRPCEEVYKENEGGDLPPSLELVSCGAENIAVTAVYRETNDRGRYVEGYAAAEQDYPYVIRLVELNGEAGEIELSVAGAVAAAYKTNLLGSITEYLTPNTDHQRSAIKLHMRAHEIATIYLDIVEGRKQTRDLDAARNVWATVHRVDE